MATAPFTVNITEDVSDTAIDGLRPGQEFSVWIPTGGTMGSATITIKGDSDADATTATLPGGSITAADTQKVFTNPSTEGRCWDNVAGSTTPDFYLVVTPLVSRRAT